MSRAVVLLSAKALTCLALFAGCGCKVTTQGDHQDVNWMNGGTITAPAALQIPAAFPATASAIGCNDVSDCMVDADTCKAACFSLSTGGRGQFDAKFTLKNLPFDQPILLPDPRVEPDLDYQLDGRHLLVQIISGSLTIRGTKGHFEADLSLDLDVLGGGEVVVTNGRYSVTTGPITTDTICTSD